MSKEELRRLLIEECGFTWPLAAKALKMKFRTLQDYARGVSGIPADVADKVRAYCADWKRYMAERRRHLQAEIDREFPEGIRP